MAIKVVMPLLGESVVEGLISRWLKKEGDKVEKYEPILEIETDKVTTEATAEVAGTLLQILVPAGETVPVGTVLAYIGRPGEPVSEGDGEAPAAERVGAGEQGSRGEAQPMAVGGRPSAVGRPPATNGGREPERQPYTGRISPVVGRIAAEHHVDLSLVTGTGRDGRITKQDILAYVEARDAAKAAEPLVTRVEPARPAATPLAGEVVPLTGIRRAIAEHMVRSKHTSPHVTTVFEVDFATVAAHREAHKAAFAHDGANLTFTAYIVAATVEGLKKHPMVNSVWSDEGVVLKREINVGLAAAIEDGLIVPVLKNADSLNLLGLARSINDLAERARSKRLKPDDVQGGTFSITNHGVSGSLFATPIINQPQCGILGVGKIEKRVKVINDALAIRPLAYVSLTFDHRILDGAAADAFVSTIKDVIENWR